MHSASKPLLAAFLAEEHGVTAVEYGLVASLIGAAIIAGLGPTGPAIAAAFNTLAITIAAVA